MPNCDYYGTIEDHREILEILFSEGLCEIYEQNSEIEQPLKKFGDTQEVLSQFSKKYPNGKNCHSVYLQLYVRDAGPDFKPRKIELNPEKCNGAKFRYSAEGWGLVQLYLSTIEDSVLRDSHTNHNSKKRAESWFSTYTDMGNPDAWDFDRIAKFSEKLNRQIRKRKVAKLGSRVVLKGGLHAWDNGILLPPYMPGEHEIIRYKK